ncbi:endolytic transglycosylase MltG [Pinisolibacter aquiterrae]|uniref:endolytic transglycosylase MltG n=1 Tax=Pinisolibacter aquiterrae TaxID=2815579 RepID=UPI001C3DA5BB|nr:endolytic transglycosylase MltG [Pinisolibacter aquiterrae]MBV5264201.1 endolytic transglycosylase MltG [Pinisolibacter aquiterrae]MCC8233705.1 endolytic transglycosylase MltG [Pinisolibacter aquiterrae]
MTSEPNQPTPGEAETAPRSETPAVTETAPETRAEAPSETRAETGRALPKSPRAAIEPSEVPPPPKRSKAARSSTVNFLNAIFSVITVIVLGAGAFAWLAQQRYGAKGPLTAPVVVVVPNATGTGAIADLLEKRGVITDATTFSLAAKLSGQAEKLKAGEYEFAPGLSMREVMEELTEGRTVQHRITFPEGWSSEQIVRRLLEDQILQGKITVIPEEGSILPETYSYSRGSTTREQILDQMKKAMERRVADAWAHRSPGLPLASPREMVILASIVEKETGKADERPRVAAVFINRLRKGMRLETDPTVLYGLYGGKAWLEGRTILRSDLASPNPYNTYRIQGLPPGPICNPGRAALEAVANPSRTNELFFVADGTGGHVFSETLEEHNRNVQRWRSIEQGRKASEAARPPLAPATPAGQNGN